MLNKILRLAVLVAVVSSCGEAETRIDSGGLTAVDVETLSLVKQPWQYTVESYGRVNIAETVAVGVESAGVVQAMKIVDGQRVSVGDLLFNLDATKHQLRVEQARANVLEASSQVEQAEQTLSRFKALHRERFLSEDQLQQARTDYMAALARHQQSIAEQAITNAELLERRIISPVSGVIESRLLEVGQHVRPGEILVIIQADGDYQVISYVNELEVLQLTVGQMAAVRVADKTFTAAIESIGHKANPRTGNYPIKLRIESGENFLREGMAAQVALSVASEQQIIMIPRDSVVTRNRQRVVFNLVNGQAVERSLVVGLPSSGQLPVISGLQAGERIIISALEDISDGTQVNEIDSQQPTAMDDVIELSQADRAGSI